MAVYALGDLVPKINPDAFVHPDATIIGSVSIGARSTVWPRAVLRGDYGNIIIGARSSVQDGSVLHATPGLPTVVGDDCVVGHIVHLEGCRLEDGCLVGSGAIVLHDAIVGAGATVGAGAVVRAGMRIPPGALAVGIPATVKEGGSNTDAIRLAASEYVRNAARYHEGLRRVDELSR
jgi:carbonic anhydrase/acetyltransferase-like protein (isoleucine patch superfamily)